MQATSSSLPDSADRIHYACFFGLSSHGVCYCYSLKQSPSGGSYCVCPMAVAEKNARLEHIDLHKSFTDTVNQCKFPVFDGTKLETYSLPDLCESVNASPA